MRANIYSIGSLGPERETAVKSGLDKLSQHMGEKVAFQTLRVKLPVTNAGLITPERVGVGKLNTAVDLHVFAVPLDRGPSNQRAGTASARSGISFIDIARDPHAITTTATHEGAHSLGFVLPSSPQHDQSNTGHCVDEGCIMSPDTSDDLNSATAYIQRLKRGIPQSSIGIITRGSLGLPPDDFCNPCRQDLGRHGAGMLQRIQQTRFKTGKIMPTTIANPERLS